MRTALRPVALLLAASLSTLASARAQQGGVTRFCTPGAHGARIMASGSASLAANGGAGDLVLHGFGLPANAVGVFVQGNLMAPPLPFGAGTLCIAGTPQLWRLGPVSSGPTPGAVRLALDFLSPAGAQITPGSTWSYQLWFRDPTGPDLTDAIAVQFVPAISIGAGTQVYAHNRSGHPLGQTVSGGVLLLPDAPAFLALWSAHTTGFLPPPPPPSIDFTRDVALAAFAGKRPTTGHSIRVQDVRLSVSTHDVDTLEHAPAPGCPVGFSETNPLQIVTVPRSLLPVLGAWSASVQVYTCP